jgi:hypothetical protein
MERLQSCSVVLAFTVRTGKLLSSCLQTSLQACFVGLAFRLGYLHLCSACFQVYRGFLYKDAYGHVSYNLTSSRYMCRQATACPDSPVILAIFPFTSFHVLLLPAYAPPPFPLSHSCSLSSKPNVLQLKFSDRRLEVTALFMRSLHPLHQQLP